MERSQPSLLKARRAFGGKEARGKGEKTLYLINSRKRKGGRERPGYTFYYT